VTARLAGSLLGERVTSRTVSSKLAPRTLDCRYVPAGAASAGPVLEIRSRPDPGSLDTLVRLYVGVDRLPHHPVQVSGADDAEAVRDPMYGRVTVFAKQGFVTHTVAVEVEDARRGARLAVRLAELVVRGNR
jgi:hypothetical protein